MSENERTSEKYNPREQRLFDQICERDERLRNQAHILDTYKKKMHDQKQDIYWMTDRVATATVWMKLKYLFGGKL